MIDTLTRHRTSQLSPAETGPETYGQPFDDDDPCSVPDHSTVPHQLVDETLRAEFGPMADAAEAPTDTSPRAHIIATAMAQGGYNPVWPNGAMANPATGTMILTEGGTQVGAETMARGFAWAMSSGDIHRQHPTKAPFRVDTVLDKTLPRLVAQVNASLGLPAAETETSAQAVQIADGSVVFSGFQPIYVYNIDTGMCWWLNQEPQAMSRKYLLDPGHSMIIMSNGHDDIDALPSAVTVSNCVQDALAGDPFRLFEDRTEADHPDQKAERIANQLRQLFANDGSDGTVMVGIVEVAAWQDARPKWRRLADYARVSSVVFWALTAKSEFRGRNRREIYEGSSPLARGAARAADLAVDAGALTLGLWAARDALGIAGIASDVPHLFAAAPAAHSAITPLPEHTAGHSPAPSTDVTQPSANHGGPQQPGVPPEQPQPTFPDTYTARPDDLNSGGPTSATSIKDAEIDFYGHQLGLSQQDIDELHANETLAAAAARAFMHDTHNPHNQLVLRDAHHWLNAGDAYSTHDQATLVQQAVAAKVHGSTAPVTPPIGPTVPEHPNTAATPAPDINAAAGIASSGEFYHARHASTEYTVPILVGVAATAAVFALYRIRSALTRRKKPPQQIEDDSAAPLVQSPETLAELALLPPSPDEPLLAANPWASEELPEGVLATTWLARNSGRNQRRYAEPASLQLNSQADRYTSLPHSHRRPSALKQLAMRIRDNNRARREKRAAELSYDW